MARILFVVNEHPNEAFAINVARRTAVLLREKGHAVIWKKLPFKETNLGVAMNAQSRLSQEELSSKTKTVQLIDGLMANLRPDLAFNFHCTPSKGGGWGKEDFEVKKEPQRGIVYIGGQSVPVQSGPSRPLYTIEIRAHYKGFPARIRSKMAKNLPIYFKWGYVPEDRHYFEETTSYKESVKQGLAPEKLAKGIAGVILKKHIPLAKRSLKPPQLVSGKVGKKQKRKPRHKKPR